MINECILLLQTLIIGVIVVAASIYSRTALVSAITLCAVCANLFVLKQIMLFGLEVTASDAFGVGCMIGLNLLQERFGRPAAQQAIIISLTSLVAFALLSAIHCLFIPSLHDTMQAHYTALCSITPRLAIASTLSYAVVSWCDIRLYAFLQKILSEKWPTIRMILCTSASQLLDTILFSFLGLYGIVNNIFDIIVFSYIVKLIVIALMASITSCARRFWPATENTSA